MRRPTAALPSVALPLCLLLAIPALGDEPVFARLAEGFTSEDEQTGIVAGQRMFSVPTFLEVCAPLVAPAALVLVGDEPLELSVGEWYPYHRMVVVAVDAAGEVLPPVPISIEVESVDPPVLNLRSDMTGRDRVLPIREGGFRLRVEAACEGHAAELAVRAEVVEG